MNRFAPMLEPYTELLRRFALADPGDDLARELALIDATELAKTTLFDGPALDAMHELHRNAQSALAAAWRGAPPGSGLDRGRECMVRGETQPLLLALMLPHELAQRAHHERRWRREHETLVAMFEQTDTPIVVLDRDGQCDDVNPAFCRATGWTRRQAVEGAAAWSAPPGRDDAGIVAGRRVRPQACSDGRVLEIEWAISSILDLRGALLNHVCIGRDIGRQRQIDDSLRENDKLRAVATLAGGIAHDFNNLLGSINGLAEICELEAAPGSRQARNLGRIREAGGRAAHLVRQMLDFSRQTAPTLLRVEIGAWLRQAEALLRAALPRHHTLALGIDTAAAVSIDTVQMEQVLLNMLRNASQAIGDAPGTVRISVDLAGPARGEAAATGTGHVRLRVTDPGAGIPPELLHKIFEPFFTTKPVGEGTGLGLAAVHGIVTGHGGILEVESTPGAGTSFSIFLPRAADPKRVATGSPAPLPAANPSVVQPGAAR